MESLNIIYRPYKNIQRSVESLSVEHLPLMKVNSSIVMIAISQKMGWIGTKVEIFENDPTLKYYFNNGKPYMRFLLEYYTEVYIKWLKSGGSPSDIIGRYDDLFEEHQQECSKVDSWSTMQAVNHRLVLLNYDYLWYKRKFLKYRMVKVKNLKLYELNGRPKALKIRDLNGILDTRTKDVGSKI